MMNRDDYIEKIHSVLENAVRLSRSNEEGKAADYIPELANVDTSLVSAAIQLTDGSLMQAGDVAAHNFSLQSVAKLIPLIGLVEEHGQDTVFSWINAEPSGASFSSIAQIEKFGQVPSNPMVNAGAIALCGRIPGDVSERAAWMDMWVERLFNQKLQVNGKVFASERNTGDRNRSLAYFLKSVKVLSLPVEEVLETYFYLCSYEANVTTMAYLPMLLANGGIAPDGQRIFSEATSNCVVSIMATCGLYNESGMYLVTTGMPAKSGVSGAMVAVATGRGGIAVSSPLINDKGGSVRGHQILEEISRELHWHFGAPWGFFR
jgi:glutaminase